MSNRCHEVLVHLKSGKRFKLWYSLGVHKNDIYADIMESNGFIDNDTWYPAHEIAKVEIVFYNSKWNLAGHSRLEKPAVPIGGGFIIHD